MIRSRMACRLWLVVIAGAGALSCGHQAALYPVQGKVLWKGQPLAGATVTFLPENRTDSNVDWPIGVTGADGTFHLETAGSSGAPAGKYKVTFVCLETPKNAPKGMTMNALDGEDRLKGRYADPDKSAFTIEVKPEANEPQPFELK